MLLFQFLNPAFKAVFLAFQRPYLALQLSYLCTLMLLFLQALAHLVPQLRYEVPIAFQGVAAVLYHLLAFLQFILEIKNLSLLLFGVCFGF